MFVIFISINFSSFIRDQRKITINFSDVLRRVSGKVQNVYKVDWTVHPRSYDPTTQQDDIGLI